MNPLLFQNKLYRLLVELAIIILVSLGLALALNCFYIPAHLFMSGVPGFSQIILHFANYTPLKGVLSTGNLYFLINIPIILLSYLKLGRRFTILTLCVVVVTTICTDYIIPVQQVTSNPLLGAIAGGAILGLGAGLAVRFGMSYGGFDIIAVYLARNFNVNFGIITFLLNILIIVGSGIINSWETALYTLVAIFVCGSVSDMVHTGEQRLTAYIVTDFPEALVQAIQAKLVHGITLIEAKGGYSNAPKTMVMVVISRFELPMLQLVINSVDPTAFVNIVPSFRVSGNFEVQNQVDHTAH